MIVLTVYGRLNPGMRDIVSALSERHRANSRKEPGCLAFDFFYSPDDRNHFVFVEEWESKAALDAHSAAPSFAEFMAAVTPCLASPLDVRVFDAARLDG